MDRLYCRGIENCSETDDKLSSLRKTATAGTRMYQKSSTSSIGAPRTSGEKNRLPETSLSRSLTGGTGTTYGLLSSNSLVSKTALKSARHGRSNFVPMDPRSLGASIKREDTWSQRSRSPSRKPSHLRLKFSTGELSTPTDEAQVNKLLPQSDDFSIAGDFEELVASDDEESKSFLLGVNTPTTLRRKKLQLSLDPVHESRDEVAKQNCSSDPENN